LEQSLQSSPTVPLHLRPHLQHQLPHQLLKHRHQHQLPLRL
jgi:hypothetical protein